MAFGDIWIVGLELLEITQLVESQDTQLPEFFVINLAFLQHHFPANDLVACSRVAGELDAANKKLLPFIHVNGEEYQLLVFVERGIRDGSEVDITNRPVRLTQIVQAFGDLGAIKD